VKKPPLLWRLAPGVLFRFPRSAAAVAFSAGVVVLATILGPLFLSSSERASLQAGMDQSGPWEAGLQIVWRAYDYPDGAREEQRHLELADEGRRLLTERADGMPGMGPATVTLLGGEASVSSSSGREAPARVVHRTLAYENVTVVEEGGPGVWLADITADSLRVEPGDEIMLRTPTGVQEARVGTIYRNIRDDPREFWSTLTDFIYKQPEADAPPAPFVLADPGFVIAADRTAQIRWNVPLSSGELDPETAKGVAREFRRIGQDVRREDSPLGAALRDLGGFAFDPAISTLLGGMIDKARDRLEASQAPTGVVTAAARILGTGLIVAAGLSLVARRRSEVRALIARGAGPASLASRFLVEGFAPVLLGAVAAVASGYAGVRLAGASDAVELSYVASLADEAALAALAALALLGASTGAAVAREERSFRARSTTRRRVIPIAAGAAVAAGGAFAYRSLESISLADSDEVLTGSILLAPIGVIAAAALAAGVVLRLVLPFVAAWARRRSTGVFLAARRLAAGSGMTHTLVIVCGTALGVMFFGVTVAGSVQRTAVAKAKTFVGSDFSFGVAPNPPEFPDDLPFPATHVTKIQTYFEGSSRPVTVLGIEPESFPDAAFWDDEFAAESPEELVGRLRDADEGPITVLAAGFAGAPPPALVGTPVPLEVVGRTDAFPGMIQGQPLLAMTRDSARRVLATGGSGIRSDLIWAKGDPEEVQQTLLAAGQAAFEPQTVDEVLDSPTIQSLVWSLGLLGAVGALASATAVAGLSLYLQARHTAAQVAAAMTRRMGLSRRAELMSWVAEIGGAGVASFAVGAATGLVTASLVHERLDIQPDLEPSPIFVVPLTIAVAAGIAVALVTAATARRLQKRMDRTSVGEIMRV
jgi:putative ABC transport system permease protein